MIVEKGIVHSIGIRLRRLMLRVICQLTSYEVTMGVQPTLDPRFQIDFRGADPGQASVTVGDKFIARNDVSFRIRNAGKLVIGNHCFINSLSSLNVLNRVTIGNNCLFGSNVHIYDHNHRFNLESTTTGQSGYSTGEVRVGDNCWLGTGVVLLPGADIGKDSVVGANVVVKSAIPPGSLVTATDSTYWVEAIKFK